MNRFPAVVALCGTFLAAAPAYAKVTSHFTAASINGGCVNGDSEGIGAGDPDRRFRIVIFDDASLSETCPAGCENDDGNAATADARSGEECSENAGCGYWNFSDKTVEKVTSANSGAEPAPSTASLPRPARPTMS